MNYPYTDIYGTEEDTEKILEMIEIYVEGKGGENND